MKGLHNRADPEGNATQCFAISAVQLLLAVSRFRFALVRLWKSKEALALCSNVTRTLAKLASALSVGKNQHSAFGEFMNAACYSAATQLSAHLSAGQNDCGEFLMHLLDHLATEPGFDAIIAGNPFDASTRIRLASVFYCGACDHEWEESRAVNDPRYDRCVSVSAAQFRSDSFIEAIDTITVSMRSQTSGVRVCDVSSRARPTLTRNFSCRPTSWCCKSADGARAKRRRSPWRCPFRLVSRLCRPITR